MNGPFQSLVGAFQQLAKGNLETRLPVQSAQDEFCQLVQAFNEMAEALEVRAAEHQQVEKVQAAIYRITEAAVFTQSMDELYLSIHQSLGKLMPVENFYIALYDPVSDLISFPYFVDQFDPPGPPVKAGRGLTEYVLRTGRALLCSQQVFQQLVEQGEVELVGTDSVDWLGAPLKTKDRVIGVMVTQSYTEGVRFSQEDKDLLEFVSTQVALTIERKRSEEQLVQMYQQEQARSQELDALNSLSSALRQSTTTDEMIPSLVERMHRLLPIDSTLVILRQPGNQHAKVVLAEGDVSPNLGRAFDTKDELIRSIIDSRQPFTVEDFAAVPDWIAYLTNGETLGPAAFVPLQSEVELLGMLLVARNRGNGSQPFSPAEVRMLTTIGDLVGNSLRRALLFEETQRRLRRVQSLRKIDVAITNSLDLRISMDVILEQVLDQTGVDAASVLLYNPVTRSLNFAGGRGFRTDSVRQTHLRIDSSYAGQAVLTRQCVNIPDLAVRTTGFLRSPSFSAEGFHAYYALPLIAKGKVTGVLEIFHRSPLDPDQDWMDFLETLAGQAAIAIDNATMFEDLQRTNQELTLAYDATIEGWSRALDLRDKETEGHTQRVANMTLQLAQAMGVSEAEMGSLRHGALLHDIGKMGIPDQILLKPGPLTDEEWVLMRMHPVYAYEMLSPIIYLKPALNIPYFHHEKWDGTGYPHGLRGEQIPLAARIFAVIDVWDALISDRPYRKAWSQEKALEYVCEQTGKHFDPQVTEAFIRLLKTNEFNTDQAHTFPTTLSPN